MRDHEFETEEERNWRVTNQGDPEEAAEAADHARKRERENLPERYRSECRPQTEVERREAEEAAHHFDEKVEEAREAGAPSEDIVARDQRGFLIRLEFKYSYPGISGEIAWRQAQDIAEAIKGEAMQIDDSYEHAVDVQEWRR